MEWVTICGSNGGWGEAFECYMLESSAVGELNTIIGSKWSIIKPWKGPKCDATIVCNWQSGIMLWGVIIGNGDTSDV